MSPVWYAARAGVRRGWTELRQTFTTGQDVFGYVLWTIMLMVPLFLLKDDPLKGSRHLDRRVHAAEHDGHDARVHRDDDHGTAARDRT